MRESVRAAVASQGAFDLEAMSSLPWPEYELVLDELVAIQKKRQPDG